MEHGVLRVSETATDKITATKAAILLTVKSETLMFGNAAVNASEDLKAAIDSIKETDDTVEVETISVSTESSTGVFGKNSTALYTIQLTVTDFTKLGTILGICSEGKKISVRSLRWEYDDETEKLRLIKEAVRKTKYKAEQMMAVISYRVVGIRACSDSYNMPQVRETIISQATRERKQPVRRGYGSGSRVANWDEGSRDTGPNLDIGVQFKNKREISATCTVEFLVKEND